MYVVAHKLTNVVFGGIIAFNKFSTCQWIINKNMTTTVMVNDQGKRIMLQGMAHVAPKKFYEHIQTVMNDYTENQVFFEGVLAKGSAVENVSLDKLYKQFAIFLHNKKYNFVMQSDVLSHYGQHGDIMLKDYPEIEKSVISMEQTFQSMEQMLRGINEQGGKYFTEARVKELTHEAQELDKGWMLDLRNQVCCEKVLESEENSILIPWGEEHIAGMQKIFEDSGFTVVSTKKKKIRSFV